MTPSDDRRRDAAEDTPAGGLPATEVGPSPEATSSVVRVSRRRDEVAGAAAPPTAVGPPPADAPPGGKLRNVTFPTVWRGYDSSAVDAYVREVSRMLSELEETRTPQDVVKRALDRVGEETAAILREAEEAAHRITTKSRSDAAERVQKAEHEAHEITQRARTRLRELDADVDRIWLERQRIIDDTRKLADRLLQIADHAEDRFPAEELEEPGVQPAPALPQRPPEATGSAPGRASKDAPEPETASAIGAD